MSAGESVNSNNSNKSNDNGDGGLVKVSVVVPVYNPGANIEGLIASLAGQSLPTTEYEVLFVDDGSTDDTPERLERACAQHVNMRTVTIPNSGWPGRPRNVGTDLAAGAYVFYADNDDELYPEALQRMHALAVANDSDIVYGKIVRTGRPTPYWQLWGRTVPVADPVADHVVQSRTIHKLFRRQFLVDHGIRFPEGKVRLEDFSFMGQAIPQARVISVLADYPCYRWIHRTDGSNNSTASVKQSTYWGYFAGALQTFADCAGDGPLLDAARLVATEQAFSRFPPGSYLGRTPAGQDGVIAALHDLVTSQVPAELDDRLPVVKRLRVQALRAKDKVRFDALQRLRQTFVTEVEVDELAWVDGVLRIVAHSTLRGPEAGSLMTADGDRLLLPLDPALGGAADDRQLRPEDHGALELTVRHRESGLEWPVAGTSRLDPETTPAGVRLRVRVEAWIDPSRNVFGDPLADGIWDVLARTQFLGEATSMGLPAPGPRAGGSVSSGDRRARAYVTKGGKVALQLLHEAVAPGTDHPVLRAAAWEEDRLRVDLAGVPSTGASVIVRHRAGGDGVEVPVQGGIARLTLDQLRAGEPADAYLRLESAAGVRDERLALGRSVTIDQRAPFAVSATPAGGLSVRRLSTGEAVPGPLVTSAEPGTTGRTGPGRVSAGRRELPSLAGLATVLPAPAQRVLRGVRRRLLARAKARSAAKAKARSATDRK